MSFRVAAGDGSVGAAGQTGGARKLDSTAQGKGPTAGLPRRVLALLINGLQLLSLTCGVDCNNKTLLKAGTGHTRLLSWVLIRIINYVRKGLINIR